MALCLIVVIREKNHFNLSFKLKISLSSLAIYIIDLLFFSIKSFIIKISLPSNDDPLNTLFI